jgi:hypothetical protein
MDTTRARAERDVLPARGASFLLEDGVLMFKFVIDTANTIGPRPAKPADAERYPAEWAAFKSAAPELIEPGPAPPAEDPAPVEAAALPVAEEEAPADPPVEAEELPAEASADEPPAAETDGDATADAASTSRRRRAG